VAPNQSKLSAFYTPERNEETVSVSHLPFMATCSLLWHTLTKFNGASPALSSPDDQKPKSDDSFSPLTPANSSFDEHSDKPGPHIGGSSGSVRAIFQTGEVLEGRFRILRVLGRGGMGEVYEAEDLLLKKNVAIKTLLAQFATDEHYRARFRREVLLAREVTHANVCRIFDVYGDTPGSSGTAGVNATSPPFMTMELLRGQTLSQFLAGKEGDAAAKKRYLSPQEALPLVIQMAAALEAAHKVGVVHRDFKSSNVFLDERPGAAQTRVVVTDFGLARMSEADGSGGVSFTGQNEFVGTPLYMAPEQVEGGEITHSTDIYALGVVLYEMVTGTWPFVGKTPRETANLRLKTSPAPPKSVVPSLDEKWNAVILRCLERAPADRFQSVREVVESLEGETAALRRRTRLQRQQLRKTIQIAAGVVFALAAALAAYHWWPERITTGKEASVAVVRFQNLSKRQEKSWIGDSLEETLTRELAASDDLRVIPTDDVAKMKQDLVLPAAGAIEKNELEKIQTRLDANDLILGGYELSGQPNDEQIRVTLQISNPSLSSNPETITAIGRESDLFGLSDVLAKNIRATLKIGDISTADRTTLRAALPESSAASRAYYEGLEKLRQFDPLRAIDFLKDAVKSDPDAPFPHVALSEAQDILGYDKEALAEAKHAQETSKGLSNPEQREIECRVLELQRSDWESAVSACRGVWELRKRLGDGLRLADVQFAAEKWNDSIATLVLLRKELPSAENSDARIDNAEARTREALTQYREMETAAQAAVDKAHKQNAKMFEAQALLWRCVARQNMDKLEDAKKDCTQANDLFGAVGDKIGQARTVTSLGNLLSKLGDTAGATSKYEQALKLATEVGSVRDRCDALLNRGAEYNDMKNPVGAERKYNESLQLGVSSGNTECLARATESLGMISRDKHEFASAKRFFGEATKSFTQLNMSADLAQVQSNTGDLLWQEGDPIGARARFEEAAKRRRDLGLRDGLGLTLMKLGDVLLAQDEIDKALADYRDAEQIQKDLHEDDDATVTQIYIARALLEKGELAEAETSTRKLAAWCFEKKDFDNETFARDVLVRSLLVQGKKSDAVTEAKTLRGRLKDAKDEETILSARITVALALATQPSFPQALTDLRAVAADARKGSFFMQELNASLAVLEAAKLQGLKSDRSSLQALVKTATSKGYLLVARKASAMLAAK
jgi:serine/threonine protein kinase